MMLLKNAMILLEGDEKTGLVDILCDDKIRGIAGNISAEADEVIDLEGMLLIPGCIDSHVHFNDPGFPHRENFRSGTTAAAWGGITTIIDMPCTSIPAVTSVSALNTKLAAISNKAVVDYALWGGICSTDLGRIPESLNSLHQAGVIGFKIYTVSSMKSFPELSYEQIADILQKHRTYLYAFHAEDREIIEKATSSLSDIQKRSPEYYVKSRPAAAEITAVTNILEILTPQNRVHFVHISCGASARKIIKYRRNSDISFETCPHYLEFTAVDLPLLKGRIKTAPPVKSREDRNFLRSCVGKGDVDFITTDHAGCDYQQEKEKDDFRQVYSGIPGIELMVMYLFSEFYLQKKTSLKTMINLTSERAARRYGLYPRKGSLLPGTDADFTVIDLKKPYLVEENRLHSLGKYSPFQGNLFKCSIDRTILRGKTVYSSQKGIQVQPGYGIWIKPAQ
ncbi:MAG: amidohydrolase family protein [Candidatus Cloacimonetes bacterium]|nr:amidohydrolase family protein [Candidatus Cloacimonadota bacterium]